MSKFSDEVYEAIIKAFPSCLIIKEHYIKFKNTKLFFDFYMKDLGVLVEVQGRQHLNFVKHFHGDRKSFLDQKKRDNFKLAYVQDTNGLCLVRFYENEKLTEDLIVNKIYTALDKGFCE